MQKLYSVQYLRATAALLVVVAHAFSHEIGLGNHFVVLAGQFGVQLFFVISGFIMVYISGTGSFFALTFLQRRAIRIVPLYWLFTGLAALLAVLMPGLFKTTIFTWPHFVQSLLFIAHEAPERGGTSPLLSLGWTLNYEAYFYVAFAALSFLVAKNRIVILILVFSVLWLAGLLISSAHPVALFYLNLSPLAFAAGCWVGYATLQRQLTPDRRLTIPIVVAALAGASLALVDQQHSVGATLSFFGQVLLAGSALLLGLIFESRLKRIVVLERLGDASYAIYLTHIFVIGAAIALEKRAFNLDGPMAIALTALVCTMLAAAAGIVTHEVIEKPLLHLFRRKEKPAAGRFDGTSALPGKASATQPELAQLLSGDPK